MCPAPLQTRLETNFKGFDNISVQSIRLDRMVKQI